MHNGYYNNKKSIFRKSVETELTDYREPLEIDEAREKKYSINKIVSIDGHKQSISLF